MKKKTFVSPTCKVVELQTEKLMVGSTEPTTPNGVSYGGSNKQTGAPKTAESRKAMHITDNGYDY